MLQYLGELGVGSEAYSGKPVALVAILNWAAPSTVSNGSLAVQEALLGSALNVVGFDGVGLAFSTHLGAEDRTFVEDGKPAFGQDC